jgi:hypothetical protein
MRNDLRNISDQPREVGLNHVGIGSCLNPSLLVNVRGRAGKELPKHRIIQVGGILSLAAVPPSRLTSISDYFRLE